MSARTVTNLLLVEDNPGDARLLREMFNEQETHDVRLVHVETMLDAELYLKQFKADVILLDLGLPDGQGLEVVRRAHIAAPHAPLVVLTGLDDEDMALQALQQGAQDYLIKGQIETRALPRVLRYAIERKTMEEGREQADSALRESESRLRRLLDSNIIGVAYWNSNDDITNANDLFLRLIGYNRQNLRNGSLSWAVLTPPEYAAADAYARVEMAATGACTPFEKELIRKDGTRVTVLVGSAFLETHAGSGSSFVMDISQRKQAEAKMLLQSAALNAADNAMVITERDDTIVWINRAFTELTGYSNSESIGMRSHSMLNSGVHSPALYEEIRATTLAGDSWSGEMTKQRKDGSRYPEFQTITPVKDDGGTITHFISIKTDLTSQRQLEEQLRQSQKMEAVGQLAAGVAHEFNNLLQALMSMASLIRLSGGSPEAAKIGTEMEVQIKRGAGLTQQLLLFSRVHAMKKSVVDLGDQIREAGILLRRLITENIRIVVEAGAGELTIDGDASQMQQVLLNLAINGRDAMPDGGTLTLRAGRLANDVYLDVEDTGVGLGEATLRRMFEPFFTTKEIGKGTGLGLAVVHGIVKQHLGHIEVESRRGEGSRFRLLLPACAGEITAREATEDDAMAAGTGRILLVEDEEGVRMGIVALLQLIGYEVTSAASGEEAISLVLDPPPDLLVSDIALPGIAGSILGERLRERWPALKVILMSGFIDDELREKGADLNWTLLQKPFDITELATHLSAAMAAVTPQIPVHLDEFLSAGRSRPAASAQVRITPGNH